MKITLRYAALFLVTFALLLPCFAQYNDFAPYKVNGVNSGYNPDAVYRLYPTENMWTFLKLNTRTGQIWQVQYTVDNDNDRMEYKLSLAKLVTAEEERNGRFTLYPTSNIYNFILLDQISGDVWQVQWSINSNNRGIIPIYKNL